ncbi:MAG TPA: DCC1-like thiol-disulfide oxidoreductase family protein [Opitutaceae bacterium]
MASFIPMPDSRVPVLLYDGECGLCNGVVRFILRHDRKGAIQFAPLQSPPGQEFLRGKGLPQDNFDTLVFIPDWKRREYASYLVSTSGVLEALSEMGGPWASFSVLRVIPRFLRDPLYTLVSRTRYALFGSYVPAPLENPAWEKRFLAR